MLRKVMKNISVSTYRRLTVPEWLSRAKNDLPRIGYQKFKVSVAYQFIIFFSLRI